MILQLRHSSFITQSLKEIHSGRETGRIDTGPLENLLFHFAMKKWLLIAGKRGKCFFFLYQH